MSKPASNSQWTLEPYSLGARLRSLRSRKGLTLSSLAAETGLSSALLSKLETDRMVPTLPTLAVIGRAYGVGLGYFFSEPTHHNLSITRSALLMGPSRSVGFLKSTPLGAPGADSALDAQLIDFPLTGTVTVGELCRNNHGVVYVLEGKLKLEVGGGVETLEAGDCVCIETDMAVNWSAVGKHRCRVLAVSATGAKR